MTGLGRHSVCCGSTCCGRRRQSSGQCKASTAVQVASSSHDELATLTPDGDRADYGRRGGRGMEIRREHSHGSSAGGVRRSDTVMKEQRLEASTCGEAGTQWAQHAVHCRRQYHGIQQKKTRWESTKNQHTKPELAQQGLQ